MGNSDKDLVQKLVMTDEPLAKSLMLAQGMSEKEVDQKISSVKSGAVADKVSADLKAYIASTTDQLNLALDTTTATLPAQVRRVKFIVEYTADEIKIGDDQIIEPDKCFTSGSYYELEGDTKFRLASKIGKVTRASGETPAKTVPVPQELIDQGMKTWKSYADSLGIMKPSQSACKILETAKDEVYLAAKAEFDAA